MKKWLIILIVVVVVLGGGVLGLHSYLRAVEHEVMWGNSQEIHFAAYENDYEKLEELINSGVDPETRVYAKGQIWVRATPLHIAAERDAVESIEVLLSAGVDINAYNSQGQSPLCVAAEHCAVKAVRILLESGASPYGAGDDELDAITKPLMHALWGCSIEVVNEFLAYGTPEELAGKIPRSWIREPDLQAKLDLIYPTPHEDNTGGSSSDE